nr:hypothetical protein [uncultured Flavobacterium sp.]
MRLKFYIFLSLVVSTISNSQGIQFDAYTNWMPQLSSYSELMNGLTKSEQLNISLRVYNEITPITNWKITVRIADDYKINNYSIPAETGLLKFNREIRQGNNSNLPVSIFSGYLPLSKYQEQTIISSENVKLENGFVRSFIFDFQMIGGNHLLTIPNGEYKTSYVFNLYKIENGVDVLIQTISNSNLVLGAHLNYNANFGNQSILLENGSNFFHFKFNSVNDIISGKSIKIKDALRVKTYNAHELIVKASHQDMQSSTSNHTLPVSIIQLDLALSNYIGGNNSEANFLRINSPIQLNNYDQVIATFPQWSSEITFDLTLTIPGNIPNLSGAKGIYETFIYFVIVPR